MFLICVATLNVIILGQTIGPTTTSVYYGKQPEKLYPGVLSFKSLEVIGTGSDRSATYDYVPSGTQ